MLPELREEVAAFLGRLPLGRENWVTADPGTGDAIAEVVERSADDVDAAVAKAGLAFRESGWAGSAAGRAETLSRLVALLEKNREVLAEIESLDTGKPLRTARGEAVHCAQTFRYYAELAGAAEWSKPVAIAGHTARVRRFAAGVCGVIVPWNFPLVLLGWNVAPALAAGNAVVIKPAEDTPLSTLYVAELAREAGVPEDIFTVVTGRGEGTGAALARHPGLQRMSFTGSPEVGRGIAAACGANLVPVKLELGGKGAAVVLADADAAVVAANLVKAVTLNSGQVCCTATRWLVHTSIYDAFVEKAAEKLVQVRIGYWNSLKSEMGPLINARQRERVLRYVRRGIEEGAEAIVPGGAAEVAGKEGGYWVKPALLAGAPDNVACREEIFGPVAYLLRFHDDDEAVRLVNQSAYGLANSVWSRDAERANRVAERLVAGTCWINMHNVFLHGLPYAGVNLSGMGGGVLGEAALWDHTRAEAIASPVTF